MITRDGRGGGEVAGRRPGRRTRRRAGGRAVRTYFGGYVHVLDVGLETVHFLAPVLVLGHGTQVAH